MSQRIISVSPEDCSGPGWTNRVIWVFLQDSVTQTLTMESIQGSDFSSEENWLFDVANAAHSALLKAVQKRGTKFYVET